MYSTANTLHMAATPLMLFNTKNKNMHDTICTNFMQVVEFHFVFGKLGSFAGLSV